MDNTKMKKYLEDIMILESEKYRLEEIKKKIIQTNANIELEYNKSKDFQGDANQQVEKLIAEKYEKIKKYLEEYGSSKDDVIIKTLLILGVIIPVIIVVAGGSMFLAIVSYLVLWGIGFNIPNITESEIDSLKQKEECKENIKKIEQEYEKKIKELETVVNEEVKNKENNFKTRKSEMMKFCNLNKANIKKIDEESEEIKNKLNQLYDLDIIFKKYRNLSAITMFFEYFSSSRVFELEGKDGAYNLYESELRQNVIINNLEKVNDNLEEIKDNQYCMYNELKNVNSSLQTINKNLIDGLNDIAKIEMVNLTINAEIAKNVKTIKRIQVYDYIMNK